MYSKHCSIQVGNFTHISHTFLRFLEMIQIHISSLVALTVICMNGVFSEEDIVVGYAASVQAEKNAHNTIYDAKRFIGKHFSKEELSSEAKRYGFKVSKHKICLHNQQSIFSSTSHCLYNISF